MPDRAGTPRPVVLVVDDQRTSFDGLVENLGRYQSGRLATEFDFEFLTCYDDLKNWYRRNRGRFVALIVQDVDFSRAQDERKLVSYPDVIKPARAFDIKALQGFLIYGYMRQDDIDRIAPVVFVSCRVGMESSSDFSQFLVNPGYGGCSFVPESALGDGYYPKIAETIDTLALRPLPDEKRREWAEKHHMVVGRARKMAFLVRDIERIGPSDAIVLLLGSPGVGKELVANALHRCSSRYDERDGVRRYPCTVNMAALDKNIIEDELFGHEQGAFTGAQEERAGIFEAGQESSVFLDEIGDIDQDIQRKLLRTIEYYRIKRLGSSYEIPVKMRIIATTNRTIEDLQMRFRPDFYSRLVQHTISVPSVRERWVGEPPEVIAADTSDLVDYFVGEMNKNPRHQRSLTVERTALRFLTQLIDEYLDGGSNTFDGNIRTLRNIIERAYERAQYDGSTQVGFGHIMPTLGMVRLMNAQVQPKPVDAGSIEKLVGSLNLAAVERKAITEALTKTGYNQTHAAELLGIHRDTLRRKVSEHNL
jgi:DNA-binding NtrC family response regulator